ncbi:MAG: ABC transporter permease [Bacteroidales bacterium]
MLKNYIVSAIRNINRQKVFSAINILGFSIGIACSILILIFVFHEISYDKFYQDSERIYRVAVEAKIGNTDIHQTHSSSLTFEKLLLEFPEIETGVKLIPIEKIPVKESGIVHYEDRFVIADSTFFEVFPIGLIKGTEEDALKRPNTIAISNSIAKKYFGDEEPVGKILEVKFDYGLGVKEFEVTAVFNDVPNNSHFHYELLASSMTFPDLLNNPGWTANNFISYLKLKEGADPEYFDEKLKEFTRKYMGEEKFDAWVEEGNYWIYYLQPMTKIHLESDLNGEMEANGNKKYVILFAIISGLILLIATINFMNLSTAKSSLRAKEIGIRKVYGARRSSLVSQFLGESMVIAYISVFFAMIIAELLLPYYNNIIGRELSINYKVLVPLMLGSGFIIGLFSGSYPSVFLSSFNTLKVLRSRSGDARTGEWMRRILVVFQFSISVVLIIATIVVFMQITYLQNKSLGFSKDNVLIVKNPGVLENKVISFKQDLASISGVLEVSGTNMIPGKSFSNIGFGAEGVDNSFTLNIGVCDVNYLKSLGVEMKAGRFFSESYPSDSSGIVINEKAANLLGWKEDAIGKKMNNWAGDNQGIFHVIGIFKDFHYESLHNEIRPMALFLNGGYYDFDEQYILIHYNTGDVASLISNVKAEWEKKSTEPFEFSFLEDDYNNLYINEIRTRRLFGFFTIISVIIASMGLFGLTSFIADQKKKEIGIRRVIGADIPRLVLYLNRQFIFWVLIANIIAWPLAWYFMSSWLENFAYRINLSVTIFIIASELSLLIAFGVMSLQTIKAALKILPKPLGMNDRHSLNFPRFFVKMLILH